MSKKRDKITYYEMDFESHAWNGDINIIDSWDVETGAAMFRVMCGALSPKERAQELARLLRMERIPLLLQSWLADRLDPPPNADNRITLAFKSSRSAARKFKTEKKELQIACAIMVLVNKYKLTIDEAIAEIMPGKERQAFRALKTARRWGNGFDRDPEVFDRRFFD
jgi:hypothetical protein